MAITTAIIRQQEFDQGYLTAQGCRLTIEREVDQMRTMISERHQAGLHSRARLARVAHPS